MTGPALTKPMRAALTAARGQPLRRVHNDQPGKPPWPAHPCTLHALVERGFLVRGELVNRNGFRVDVWTITDAGHDALNPPLAVRRRGPLYIAEGWPDYTGDSSRKMRGEPEALHPPELWALQSGTLHTATRQHNMDERFSRPLTPDERYRELLELAHTQGIDIRADDRVIRRRLDAMERKLRHRAA